MGRQSIEGFSYQGALEDFDTLTKLARKRFVTVLPLGPNRSGLDVITNGLFVSGAANRVVEAGSTDSIVNLTAHGAAVGDVIRINTTANPITQREVAIKEIIDANSFLLEGRLDADLTAGDTFDIMRGVSQTFTSSGGIVTGPVQFTLDGTDVTVNEDTVTPANNRPLPVKLTNITGDINITAGDLNVQLDHTGATFDSVRVGDGTTLLAMSGAGEALTQPGGNVAANAADAGNPVKMGARYDAVLPTYDDADRTDLHSDVNGRLLVSSIVTTLPGTFAEDAAHTDADFGMHLLSVRQDTLAASTSADNDYASLKSNALGEVYMKDSDMLTETQNMNAKLVQYDQDTGAGTENLVGFTLRISGNGGSIEAKGQQLMANSLPVVIASDQSTLPISASALPLPTGAATEATLALVEGKDFATETTLAAHTAKFPVYDLDTGAGTEEVPGFNLRLAANGASILAQGQQVAASSIPVVPASDYVPLGSQGKGQRQFVRNDYSSTNVTTGAFVELTASLTQDMDEIEIFDSSGQTLEIATGAGGGEVPRFLVFPGGNGRIPIDRTVFAAATRISIRAVSADAVAGEISINFYSN